MKKAIANRDAYRFRRFERKSYSAFASMHKCVTIGNLSVDICNSSLKKSEKDTASLLWNEACFSDDEKLLTDDNEGLEIAFLSDLNAVLVAETSSEKAASGNFVNKFIQK